MTQSKTVHIISHTHWDREWYLPYEKHHVLLIKLMDTLIQTLRKDDGYRSFHLDGQTIILEDYLQIRPEMKETLEQLIRGGRIHIGPWYVLQDEFLTSSEANVRNLLIGHRDAKAYGCISKLGYFPDSFGNMGQAPQLLRQADIKNAVFGRGVKPTGFNNEVSESQAYESPYSEMFWEAPDGSKVLGILFANWYSNGNEIPVNPEAASKYWDKKLAEVSQYASTPHWLFMNGCDHQPVQTDLTDAIGTAEKLYPDIRFIHSNFEDYLSEVNRTIPGDLSVIRGELRSQHTDGWSTLVNTASSRVYIKQRNQEGQTLLEKVAEPLAAFAYQAGCPYPHHLFTYAWKTLMQNHPHDSICGCSVDEVHVEMMTRFEKSKHVAESIAHDSLTWLAERVDTSVFSGYGKEATPFLVTNTTGWERSGTVTVQLELNRVYFRDGRDFRDMRQDVKQKSLDDVVLVDVGGKPIPFGLEDMGIHFGYDLPDDKFRQPYFARAVRVTFEAANVPALGYKTYALTRDASLKLLLSPTSLIVSKHAMENEYLSVQIAEDGSLTVTEKLEGTVYKGLGVYENTGDIGNEYMYRQACGDTAVTTRGIPASIRIQEDTPYRASIEIVHELEIPASAEELLEMERKELVWFTGRKSARSDTKIILKITTVVSLDKNGKRVDIASTFNNQAKDHRLRMLFPTGLEAETHFADSVFEVPERSNTTTAEWKNPSNCQHQQAFVTVAGARQGLTIANRGLNEYEIVREDSGQTIAVTLLRAVGELGDWGYFPTPEAQCLGEHTVHLSVIPYAVPVETAEEDPLVHGSSAIQAAHQYQIPWSVRQTEVHHGELPPTYAFGGWEGQAMVFSAMKVSEETGDMIARWYNISAQERVLKIDLPEKFHNAYKSDILERRLDCLQQEGAERLSVSVRPAEIVTISFEQL
ncbi:alpha-mannosidase [Paenibacillus sp. Soil724D2]|uniref:alpha-mannosidase n=1 Tax=Paenibacillus sp. (strain Soil724D2) TaxID=1736392 RepID=UPI000714803E|nr:alpha-mannosidase [Paenibacillus sp. Soil724D2]KRE49117.1 alpha-mannosidase [Paenibacillus sp. Soil724D2]